MFKLLNEEMILDILQAMLHRISIRTYEPQPASATDLEEVRRFGGSAEALTSLEMRFHLRTHEDMGKQVKGVIGNYGKTIIAPHYIVLTSQEGDGFLADAGFRFEQMVLEATRRGLGTCWVGLMFEEASLRSFLGLDASWRVIALTPIGVPGEQTLVSRALRTMVGSPHRKRIEQIFFWQRHGVPVPGNVRGDTRLSRIFEATRWAPSWKNIQPWFFILTGSEVLIYKKKTRNREGKDYHQVDCGIAMSHLHLAAREMGFRGQWKLGSFEVPGEPDAEPVGRYPLKI